MKKSTTVILAAILVAGGLGLAYAQNMKHDEGMTHQSGKGHSMQHDGANHGNMGQDGHQMEGANQGAMIQLGDDDPATGHDMEHGTMNGSMPTEPGESGFATISEIVKLLQADPETDWTLVDIDALRAHLQDMNNLMMLAEVTSEATEDGVRMTVSLAGPGGGAASRMVPAHGPVIENETGWTSHVEMGTDSVTWTVEDATGVEAAKIQALGFFGIMALGDHHQPHHLAMAKGAMPH